MKSRHLVTLFLALGACAQTDPPGGRARVSGGDTGSAPPAASTPTTPTAPLNDFGDDDIVVRYLVGPDQGLFAVEVGGDVDGDAVEDLALRVNTGVDGSHWVLVSGGLRGDVTVDDGPLARITGWADPTHYAGHLALGDLDGDGDVDAVVKRQDGIVVLEGPLSGDLDVDAGRLVVAADLSGSFTSPQADLQLIDYDRDGQLELAFEWSRPVEGHLRPAAEAWVFDGPFDTTRALTDARLHVLADLYYPMSDEPDDERLCLPDAIPVPVGDVDGDGVGSMVIRPAGSCALEVWVASGDVAGEAVLGVGGIPLEAVAEPIALTGGYLGDLDGDGRDDLVLTAMDYQGIASGLPPEPIAFETNAEAMRLAIAWGTGFVGAFPDLDGDGRDEVLTTVSASLEYAIFSGAATGTTGQEVEPLGNWRLQGTPIAYARGAAAGPIAIVDSNGFVGIQIPASN